MKNKWYTKQLRIAALQFNNEKGENLKVPARWRAMGFNCEQLKHITDVEGQISRDFHSGIQREPLTAYLRETRKNRLKTILYLNVHVLPHADNGRHTEWAQQNAAGEYEIIYDTYYCICTNSSWRGNFFKLLEQAAAFDIDGVFLDGPIIIAGGCFCGTCRKLFRKKNGRELKDADKAEQWRFNAEALDRFMREAYRRFKAVKPDSVFYNNLGALHPTPSYILMPNALDYNDLVGTEGGFFGSPPGKAADGFKTALTVRVLEGLAPAKPRVNFMAADNKPWSWYAHAPAETKLCIASTVANACNIWYGLHGSTELLATPGGLAAGDILRKVARHEAYYTGTRSVARVVMLYSFASERIYHTALEDSDLYGKQHDGKKTGGNLRQAVFGFADVLIRSNLPFDVIPDGGLTAGTLCRYECVLLPAAACLADADLKSLREYVAGGGNLVAAFDASCFTPEGAQRPDFGLKDVFGATSRGKTTPYGTWNYFSAMRPDHALFQGLNLPLYPAPAYGLDIAPLDGAEVLARFHGALAGRYDPLQQPSLPAMIWNRYGKGQCLYLAGTFGEMCYAFNPDEYRLMLRNAIQRLAHSPVILAGDAANVEVVVRARGRRMIVHLVNHDGVPPRPYMRVHPKRNLRLILPGLVRKPACAHALMSDQFCRCAAGESGLIVSVPAFEEYEAVVIE